MNSLLYVILFVLCVFTSSCAQILLKKGSLNNQSGIKAYLNKYVISGYSIFLLMTVFSTFLYKKLDLSLGTALDSLGYIFIIVLSYAFLSEKLTKKKVFGIIVIALGVIIYAIG